MLQRHIRIGHNIVVVVVVVIGAVHQPHLSAGYIRLCHPGPELFPCIWSRTDEGLDELVLGGMQRGA